MLFSQRDTDTYDPQRLRMARQHADEEPQHAIDRRCAGNRRHQRRLRGAKGAQLAFPGHAGKGARTGWNEHDSDARVAVAGMDEREGTLAPDLPGSDLLARDAPLQSAQEALPTRVLAGVDRDLHA